MAQAARFFINGLHTTTKGIDVVAHYKLRTRQVGTFDLTVAGNVNTISVDSYPTSSTATLFARQRILTITRARPAKRSWAAPGRWASWAPRRAFPTMAT
jgi:iron complex outermembrane receptor protein